MPVSPLAPKTFPKLPVIKGVTLATAQAGIRYKDRADLLLATFTAETTVAGAFTRSLTAAAPVEWCRRILLAGIGRALVVNSGNSNAFTGHAGEQAMRRVVEKAAGLIDCLNEEVYIASTGVIGELLPDAKITSALPTLYSSLKEDNWEDAARAIMTTDTFPKLVTRTAKIGNDTVTINGIAKGSGMIAPDMATMLAFFFTDAAIPRRILQTMLSEYTVESFNSITVDSDTSTSDTVLLFATGKAQHHKIEFFHDPLLDDFKRVLRECMIDLAQQIVRDGEGAEKFVTIHVKGAVSRDAARRIGLAIGNSPLVKTAIAGEDPNWGRIVAAVGKSGEMANRDRLGINIGGTLVAKDGHVCPTYVEAPVKEHFKTRDIQIEVDVGMGKGEATIWTCDLTHRYIDINASYRS